MSVFLLALLILVVTDGYYIHQDALSWNDSRHFCIDICQSELASIRNITELLNLPYINNSNIWLGLHHTKQSLTWSDCTDFNEINFAYNHSNYPWINSLPPGLPPPAKFILINETVSITDAQTHCQQNYGTALASIHNNDDMMEAQSLCATTAIIINNATEGVGCHIGLKRNRSAAIPDTFYWIDESEWDFGNLHNSSWKHGEYPWAITLAGAQPNDYKDNNGEDCVFLWPTYDNQWVDIPCKNNDKYPLCNANPTALNLTCIALKADYIDPFPNKYKFNAENCNNQYSVLCNDCILPKYYLSPNLFTSTRAETFCNRTCSSNLVSIHNQTQNEYIINEVVTKSLLEYEYAYHNTVWMGLYKDINGSWYWNDGSLFDFGTNITPTASGNYPWAVGEPNAANQDTKVCGQFLHSKQYQWDDAKFCNVLGQFVCNKCDAVLHKYVMESTKLDYDAANERCMDSYGTTLASIHSDDDNQYVGDLCGTTGFGTACWIGLNDYENEGDFVWIDGTDNDYAIWTDADPNGYLSGGALNWHDCAQIYARSDGYRWHDTICYDLDKKYKFVCNMPSEICFPDLWSSDDADLFRFNRNTKGCQLQIVNGDNQQQSEAIISEKQWINSNDVLTIEYKFRVQRLYNQSVRTGIKIYYGNSTSFFIGISALDPSSSSYGDFRSELRIDQTTWTHNCQLQRINIDTDYTLKIQTFLGNIVTNIISTNMTTCNSYLDYTKYMNEQILWPKISGNIAIFNWGYDIEVKSLFISGSAIYSKSYDPSKINLPTNAPTADSEPGISIEIIFRYNISNETDNFNPENVIQNITSELIDDSIINKSIGCYEPNYDINVKISGNDTKIAYTNATIILCNDTERDILIAYIDTDFKKLLIDRINHTDILLLADSTLINIVPVSIPKKAIWSWTMVNITEYIDDSMDNPMDKESVISDIEWMLIIIGCLIGCCVVICCVIFIVKIRNAHMEEKKATTSMIHLVEVKKPYNTQAVREEVINNNIKKEIGNDEEGNIAVTSGMGLYGDDNVGDDEFIVASGDDMCDGQTVRGNKNENEDTIQ